MASVILPFSSDARQPGWECCSWATPSYQTWLANFLTCACLLLSIYPLYLAPYFFSFEPSSTCLTFQLFGHVHNLQGSNFTLMARDNKSIKDAFLWEQHFFLSEMYFSQWSYLDGIAAFASSGENWRRERFFFTNLKQFGAYCWFHLSRWVVG